MSAKQLQARLFRTTLALTFAELAARVVRQRTLSQGIRVLTKRLDVHSTRDVLCVWCLTSTYAKRRREAKVLWIVAAIGFYSVRAMVQRSFFALRVPARELRVVATKQSLAAARIRRIGLSRLKQHARVSTWQRSHTHKATRSSRRQSWRVLSRYVHHCLWRRRISVGLCVCVCVCVCARVHFCRGDNQE